jgi:hypothetical protein
MILAITSVNEAGEVFRIPLSDDPNAEFVVLNATGLGAPPAVINTAGGYSDGERVNSSRVTMRTIELTIAVPGQGAIENINRNKLYRHFPIKREIEFRVTTDARTLTTQAWVKTLEYSMFSELQNASITLVVPNAFFTELDLNDTVVDGIEPMFEFPFSNESLTEPMLVMAEIKTQRLLTIAYGGTIETGITVRLDASGDVYGINIFNNTLNQSLRIDTTIIQDMTGTIFTSGDSLFIDTRVGRKSVKLLRLGQITNVLNALNPDVGWITLAEGTNDILFTADNGFENLSGSIEYSTLYQGV